MRIGWSKRLEVAGLEPPNELSFRSCLRERAARIACLFPSCVRAAPFARRISPSRLNEFLLIGVSATIFAGMVAMWIAWRLNLPSILILLLTGFTLGPFTGLLAPEEIFGELMHPFISLAVAIILFEGGLSLRLQDLEDIGKAVRNLVTVGVGATWGLVTLAAHFILGLPWNVSILFGAILVVTGPTVIVPLVNFLRPKGRIGTLVKWEGIVNDPVGAILAVLVFEAIEKPTLEGATQATVDILARTVVFGGGLGVLGAILIAQALKRFLLPDSLRNPITLAIVLAVFTLSNHIQHESGLLAVTVMGVLLANQKGVTVHSIIEFKEDLRVLLIAGLFIILAANLDMEAIRSVGVDSLIFLVVLIVVIRPVAIFLSSLGTDLNWREQVFLIWMAPRGIVAAAVSSIFALRLEHAGVEGASELVPVTFVVITGTVAFYGLTASFVARRIGLTQGEAPGVLIVGAQSWVRQLGRVLRREGVEVMMVDNNHSNIVNARAAGLRATETDVLTDQALEDMDLGGLGRMFAMTSNDEINQLAALNFERIFGTANVFRLPNHDCADIDIDPAHHKGRMLFGPASGFECMASRVGQGERFQVTEIGSKFDLDEFCSERGGVAIPLLLIDEGNEVHPITQDADTVFEEGHKLVYLAPHETLDSKTATESRYDHAKGE